VLNTERYIRQTTLKGFGNEGQNKLNHAKVLVIGAGGLGIPVLTYLNAMGVGEIGIVDNDIVSKSNLHRQVLYTENDIGRSKVKVASDKLKAQNPETRISIYETYLNTENALEIIIEFDIVVDASDNFPTRYLVNDACVILNKPLVYGALHGYEGQLSVFNHKGGPTYRCLFPNMPNQHEVPNCNEHGVLGIIPGIIGNLQALEVVKVITGVGEVLSGKLLIFDGLKQSFQKIKFKLRPEHQKIIALQDFYEWNNPCEIIPTIKAEKIQSLLKQNIQLIDVRTHEEYSHYHLPHTLHIPLERLRENLGKIDFRVPIYIICQSGKRSEHALKELQPLYPESTLLSVLGGINKYLDT